MSAVHTRMRGPYRAIQKHNDTVLSVMVTILDEHTVEVHVQTQKNTDGGSNGTKYAPSSAQQPQHS